MAGLNFKSDESFLQKLAVGAAGTRATMSRLRELGFMPVELERGSAGYKIWKTIKIKRVRVPDILCLRSGTRFESRGKTKLELSMSHSLKDPNRAWDASLRQDDMVAVLLCTQVNDSPVDWLPTSPIHFIRVAELKRAVSSNVVQVTKPKGVEEGSEVRMIWPIATAHEVSTVESLSGTTIGLRSTSGTPQRIMLGRKNVLLMPQCHQGDAVAANQIVASCVPIELAPTCTEDVDEAYFRDKLQSASLSERYAAAKALRLRGFTESLEVLTTRMQDPEEDIYVKLETAAALASHNDDTGWAFLSDSLASQFLTIQLETVIVLSELPSSRSQDLLIQILTNAEKHPEVRAGAAWGLGEFRNVVAVSSLIDAFNLESLDIKTEAARALLKISPEQIAAVLEHFKQAEPTKRDGIAWALSRTSGYDISSLFPKNPDDDLRRWISFIVGFGKSNFATEQIQALSEQDPHVEFGCERLMAVACELDLWPWRVLSAWPPCASLPN
jgi:hypothetical protein